MDNIASKIRFTIIFFKKSVSKKTMLYTMRDIIFGSYIFAFKTFKLTPIAASVASLFRRSQNNYEMRQLIKKQHPRDGKSIPAIYRENYDVQWGQTNYKDTIVLDFGADVGSTASFFLQKGAKKVVAIEG